MEPLIKIRMLTKSIPDRRRNIERYRQDYEVALQDYFAGRMNVDDLLRRRQGLLNEEFNLSFGTSELGGWNVALAAATGKFFELLAQAIASQPVVSPASQLPPTTRGRGLRARRAGLRPGHRPRRSGPSTMHR